MKNSTAPECTKCGLNLVITKLTWNHKLQFWYLVTFKLFEWNYMIVSLISHERSLIVLSYWLLSKFPKIYYKWFTFQNVYIAQYWLICQLKVLKFKGKLREKLRYRPNHMQCRDIIHSTEVTLISWLTNDYTSSASSIIFLVPARDLSR